MKHCFLLLGTLFLFFESFAGNITAVPAGGDWNVSATWDLKRVPDDGDMVTINSGVTVTIKNTVYDANKPALRPSLQIKIYGVLDFSSPGNDRLYLDQGSTIQVFPGGFIKTLKTNTEIIAIYNGTSDNIVWNGTPSTIEGPQYATSTSGFFSYGVLPVKLKSFTARVQNNQVALNWSSAEEQEVKTFYAERSANGTNWTTVAEVGAQGSNSDYTARDAMPAAGTSLYRLKSVDIDGSFSYSIVVRVNLLKPLSVLMNTAIPGTLTISLSDLPPTPVSIRILNTGGQVLRTQLLDAHTNFTQLNTSTLSKGLYTVLLFTNSTLLESRQVLLQ